MSKLVINTQKKKNVINKNIYGHFSEHLGRCIYGGIFVGENSPIPHKNGMRTDVVEAMKNIRVPVLRWPGGCFADEYHWKDGIGPKKTRKKMINTHWGGVVEDNSFGTHEFMELCAQVGCEPYVNGNVGSGIVQEMSEWMEYMTFGGVSPMAQLREKNGRPEPWKVFYFGVGNENWGCGGNMRPGYYADLYRRFQTYVRDYGNNKVFKIACGPNTADYGWTDKVMEIAGPFMDALTLHYYTVPGDEWENKGSALSFTEAEYYKTLKKALFMDELIDNHTRIMRRHDPDGKVGLIVDEWGTWYNVEEGTNPGFLYQQNTMRDALVAAVNLNIFNRYSDRVVMANIAQTVNVLQAIILTEGDKMLLTPTYHVFDLYKEHQNAALLESYVECGEVGSGEYQVPQLDVSASQNAKGAIHITLANLCASHPQLVECPLPATEAKTVTARILQGKMNAHNNFDAPQTVKIEPFTGIETKAGGFAFTMPACSVMEITVE